MQPGRHQSPGSCLCSPGCPEQAPRPHWRSNWSPKPDPDIVLPSIHRLSCWLLVYSPHALRGKHKCNFYYHAAAVRRTKQNQPMRSVHATGWCCYCSLRQQAKPSTMKSPWCISHLPWTCSLTRSFPKRLPIIGSENSITQLSGMSPPFAKATRYVTESSSNTAIL